jgi:hypothetical protein
MHADIAASAIRNHLRDRINASIEEINLAAFDRKPRATDDPWASAANWGHLCPIRIIDEDSFGLQQPACVQRASRAIVQAEIVVGHFVSRSARP